MIEDQRQALLGQRSEDSCRQAQYGTNDASGTSLQIENSHYLTKTLFPPDAFEGTLYWADLDSVERSSFAREQYRTEARHDWHEIHQMFKVKPWAPLSAYVRTYVAPGAGFFAEGSVLFSVGNTMPLLKALWPECWLEHSICDFQMIRAIKYMEILGIIFGQSTVGFLGDRLGKRRGLIQDAAFMLLGTILLTSMWGETLSGWTIMYGVAIFVFSYGVGGEYPMTSTTSMEKYQGREDRLHRGRNVLLAFLMQGWGQLANQIALIILLLLFNKGLNPPFSEVATQITLRVSFAIAGLALLYILYFRFHMAIPTTKKDPNRKPGTFGQITRHHWHRILATTVCWFCSDFAFYGNQVFRNQLLRLVTGAPNGQVRTLWLYNLINIGCELTGYYCAALLIDHKLYGRKRMQMLGFGVMSVLFATVSGGFNILNQPGTGAKVFQAIFFFSNFWVQFGPNCTTFLVAGEVYPPSVRSTLHGISAAVGKAGALTATVLYNYIDDRTKFVLVTLCSVMGLILTVLFVPDTTGLNLDEQSRYWQLVVRGHADQYHGVAIHPRHLSWYENTILRRSDHYDLTMDRMMKIAELRDDFDKTRRHDGGQLSTDNAKEFLDPDVVKFFELENSLEQR